MALAGLLAVSEMAGAPRITVQSPSGLYLLAQLKLAVGDTGCGLDLIDRAFAERDSLVSQAGALDVSSRAPRMIAP